MQFPLINPHLLPKMMHGVHHRVIAFYEHLYSQVAVGVVIVQDVGELESALLQPVYAGDQHQMSESVDVPQMGEQGHSLLPGYAHKSLVALRLGEIGDTEMLLQLFKKLCHIFLPVVIRHVPVFDQALLIGFVPVKFLGVEVLPFGLAGFD